MRVRVLVHKQDPILALVMHVQEWATNQHRAQEWAATSQGNPGFLAQQGILGLQVGQQGQEVILLVTFPGRDQIREWLLDRHAYTQEQYVQMCRDHGRDPQEYLSWAQVEGQGFTIRF